MTKGEIFRETPERVSAVHSSKFRFPTSRWKWDSGAIKDGQTYKKWNGRPFLHCYISPLGAANCLFVCIPSKPNCIYLHSSSLIKSFPRRGAATTVEKMILFFNRLSSSSIQKCTWQEVIHLTSGSAVIKKPLKVKVHFQCNRHLSRALRFRMSCIQRELKSWAVWMPLLEFQIKLIETAWNVLRKWWSQSQAPLRVDLAPFVLT